MTKTRDIHSNELNLNPIVHQIYVKVVTEMGILAEYVTSFIGLYITLLVVQKVMRGIPDIKRTTSPTKRDIQKARIL